MTTDKNVEPAGGHLDYYKQHGIAPVQYQMDNFREHQERRDSLYRSLGLPPVAFKGAAVLEVAPGTGQNSLYIAARLPASLDLVEPNPAGLTAIEKSYAGMNLPHTSPKIHATRLEEFEPGRRFDIVLCENWLGALPGEVALIKKLASLIAPGGVMVLTVVPLAGFFPNVMRKLLALRITPPGLDFEARTSHLVGVFGPHLATMASMTRSHRDWVHDCMINPHYLNVALPLETVFGAVGNELEALATFPRFAMDWRWFKGLTGQNRRFNASLVEAEARNLPSFLDYRLTFPERTGDTDLELSGAFAEIHRQAVAWQQAFEANNPAEIALLTAGISKTLMRIEQGLKSIDLRLSEAVGELAVVWRSPAPTAAQVRDMPAFSGLFGRETVYLSLTRPF